MYFFWGEECEWHCRSVNCRNFVEQPEKSPNMRSAPRIRISPRRAGVVVASFRASRSSTPLRDPPANNENQGTSDEDGGANIAEARVDGRRNRRRQRGIQHALNAKTEPRDNPPQRIDHRGNAGVCGANDR